MVLIGHVNRDFALLTWTPIPVASILDQWYSLSFRLSASSLTTLNQGFTKGFDTNLLDLDAYSRQGFSGGRATSG